MEGWIPEPSSPEYYLFDPRCKMNTFNPKYNP